MPDPGVENAVRNAAENWLLIPGEGDPNTIDLLWLAQQVRIQFQIQLPQTLAPKADGVAIVELVERHFVCARLNLLIRQLPPEQTAKRSRSLLDEIERTGMQPGPRAQKFVIALYSWHGCINMAKLLRPTHNVPGGQVLYTEKKRIDGYDWLRETWEKEMADRNPWVRYGVSLARQLELGRKKADFSRMVVEGWVPRDSPYWAT